jgi:DNA-3-methyladenine glycosylase II
MLTVRSASEVSSLRQAPCNWVMAANHLRKVDRALIPIMKAHGLPQWTPTKHPFEALGRNIVYQQLSGAAAGTIYKRLTGIFDGKFPSPAAILEVPVETLRGAGLSGAKVAALKDLALHVHDKKLKPKELASMTNNEIVEVLLPVRGIGPWSVDMFLMFALSRPDVLPVGDLGVRKGMQKLYGLRTLPAPATMEKRAAPWLPFRTLGAWLMWRALEMPRHDS